MRSTKITLIGAGLAGCLLAIYLARRGFSVQVFERRPDMRKHAIPAGRSINLSLSTRGIHALQEVELYGKLEAHLVAMPGRMIHGEKSELLYQPYGGDPSAVHYSVGRVILNKLLLDAAESAGAELFFEAGCAGLDFGNGRLFLGNEKDGTTQGQTFDTVIAMDGAGSVVRHAMIEQRHIQGSDEDLAHGYKELTIPARPNGACQLEKNALHIWPRGGFMLIALPNTDGSFTCTLFLPYAGPLSFETLRDEKSVLNFFETEFPDALPLIPSLSHDFLAHPTGTLGTVRCFPWHVGGKALLLGDAAHAVVPFHGQGMNCAFEDCAVFNQLLDKHQDWKSLYLAFEASRKPNAEAIADMALENYIEMRDAVRDSKFHLCKKIEWLLEARHPQRFISRYAMVMFHRIPYLIAQARGEIQSAILGQLSASIDRVEDVDLELADKLIVEKLTPLSEEESLL
jgi:kynurenine 3-monooxygenase